MLPNKDVKKLNAVDSPLKILLINELFSSLVAIFENAKPISEKNALKSPVLNKDFTDVHTEENIDPKKAKNALSLSNTFLPTIRNF